MLQKLGKVIFYKEVKKSMFKKMTLRWRLTLFSSLLIAICCIGLSILLNVSAYRMVDVIDAYVIQPAQSIDEPLPENQIIPALTPNSSDTVLYAKRSYLMQSFIYTVTAVSIGGILTYSILGKALEPVKTLNNQIKNIHAHNLDESLEIPPTHDELAELTLSFNDMTAKLSQAFLMQKRFSADAAHELKTPLTVLQTKLDVFQKRENHTLEEYQTLIDIFQKQVKRLRHLVSELLDIASMNQDIQKENISLTMLIDDIINELTPIAEVKHIELINSVDDYLLGDYDLLYRAFYNLIENAIKYNVENGYVRIETKTKQDELIIMIKDTGIGVLDSMKKQIFEPFYRVDKSRSREMGGAGLGLPLVDTIIKKHTGTIHVVDHKPKGSCFIITLPK